MILLPWQEKLMHGLMQGRELKLTMSGRNMGKSHFTQQAIDRLLRDINSQPVSEMVLQEGRVYGSRYYTVEPIGGNWLELERWCGQVFGEGGIWCDTEAPEPAQRWYANNRKFWFKTQKDRDWFLVMWRS
jgi:hypothetical protein